MIRIPKIYLYRPDGKLLTVGGLAGSLTLSHFSYTEAEGTDNDRLTVKLNVSERYYSALSGINRGSDISFTYGYMSWQSKRIFLKVNNVKSTYGGNGYIVEIEGKPSVDVDPGRDPNGSIEDIFAGVEIVLQVKAREENVVETVEQQQETAKMYAQIQAQTSTQREREIGQALGTASEYGALVVAAPSVALQKAWQDYKKAQADKREKDSKYIAQTVTYEYFTKTVMDGLKDGTYTVSDDGSIVQTTNGRVGGGVTTRGSKIILLANQQNQVAKPSHSFYPHYSIINIVFSSKERSAATLETTNGTIDPDNKSESITTIMSNSGYVNFRHQVGKKDQYVDYYVDRKTGDIYTTTITTDLSSLTAIKVDPNTAKAIRAEMAKQDAEDAEYQKTHGKSIYYRRSDGSESSIYAGDELDVDRVNPDKHEEHNSAVGVRTDIDIDQTRGVASYITHPTENVDALQAIHETIEDMNIENALIGVFEDANFYRNTATLKIEGRPTVHQGQTIYISGFASVFSGLYIIRKVTHLITTSGYVTDIISTRVPDTYEEKLKKAQAAYGQQLQILKDEAIERAYKKFQKQKEELNEYMEKNGVIVDSNGEETKEYEVDGLLMMDYTITTGGDDSGKNWKFTKDEDGNTILETRNVEILGDEDRRRSNDPNNKDFFKSNQRNVNDKYNGDDKLYMDGSGEVDINSYGDNSTQSTVNEAQEVIIENNNP